MVQHQLKGINFGKLIGIVVSWFVSPLLAGVVAILWFAFIKYFVLLAPLQCRPFKPNAFGTNALTAGLLFLPLFYGITVFCNTLSIFLSAPPTLRCEMGKGGMGVGSEKERKRKMERKMESKIKSKGRKIIKKKEKKKDR